MSKNAFLKRAGQIYGVGIQYGFTYEELLLYLNDCFAVLYKNKGGDIK